MMSFPRNVGHIIIIFILIKFEKKLSLLKKNHIFDLKGKNYKNLG